MNQTEFVKTGAGATQNEIVLRLLEMRRGDWVGLTELVEAGGGYAVHSRVADLRREGHVIENRTERKGRRRVSSYRYCGCAATM